MINNINKYLNMILEQTKVKTPILINPSLPEIKKKLYESKRLHGHTPSSLRFIMWRRTTLDNKSESGYYIADAEEWVHRQMKDEMKIPPATDYVFGEFTDDGYLWFYRYMLYDYLNITNSDRVFHTPKEVIDLFKTTELYKVIKPIINKIEYQ